MCDEGWPLELGLQDQGSNHQLLRRSQDWGGERVGKGGQWSVRCGWGRRTQVNRWWRVERR